VDTFHSAKQGAATPALGSVTSALEDKWGTFLANCVFGVPANEAFSIIGAGYAPYMYDEQGENRLSELSSQLTDVKVNNTSVRQAHGHRFGHSQRT
jgi:hypothetical protein